MRHVARAIGIWLTDPDGTPFGRRFSHLLADSGWILAATAAGGVFALLQNAMVAQAFGVEPFATFVLVVGTVTVVNQLTSFRMNEFVVRYVSGAIALDRPTEGAAALKLALMVEATASGAAFLVIVAAGGFVAASVLGTPEQAPLVLTYGWVVLANLVSETTVGAMQAFELFRVQAVLSTISRAFPALGTLVAVAGGGALNDVLAAVVFGTAAGALLQSAVMIHYAGRRLGRGWWRVSSRLVSGGRRKAARFAVSTNVGSTLSLVTKDADVVWLGLLRPAAEAGFYRLAFQLAAVALMPVPPLAQRLYAEMSRAAAAERWTSLQQLLRRATLVTGLYVVPVGIGLAALAPWMIRLLFGAEFSPATPALLALLPGMAIANVLVWTRPSLLALHETEFTVRLSVLLAAVKGAGLLTIVPLWGYVANAALVSVLYAFGVGVCMVKVLRLVRRRVASESPIV
jgi:O-antigen/teichoic acid export membrane protein